MTSLALKSACRPIAVTLAALVAYRLASQLPLPGVDLDGESATPFVIRVVSPAGYEQWLRNKMDKKP